MEEKMALKVNYQSFIFLSRFMKDLLLSEENPRSHEPEVGFEPFEMLKGIVEKVRIQQVKPTCEIKVIRQNGITPN
jgi:hypothetical protein